MPRFEARLRAAVLVVTAVASWTMLIGQGPSTHTPADPAVPRPELADPQRGQAAAVEVCPGR